MHCLVNTHRKKAMISTHISLADAISLLARCCVEAALGSQVASAIVLSWETLRHRRCQRAEQSEGCEGIHNFERRGLAGRLDWCVKKIIR